MQEFVKKFDARFFGKTVKRILKGDHFLLPFELRESISEFEGEVDKVAEQISELSERIEKLHRDMHKEESLESDSSWSGREARSDSSPSVIDL
ncbi:hypothetical protein [Kistimonas asteriae]|uniref:hypothetical protein n=1 Tax=Kistimonas asteriae TaxID=517724 RepID=UPI001BADB0C0|nr:hypothetical protein [Kistimonas asteriae]